MANVRQLHKVVIMLDCNSCILQLFRALCWLVCLSKIAQALGQQSLFAHGVVLQPVWPLGHIDTFCIFANLLFHAATATAAAHFQSPSLMAVHLS